MRRLLAISTDERQDVGGGIEGRPAGLSSCAPESLWPDSPVFTGQSGRFLRDTTACIQATRTGHIRSNRHQRSQPLRVEYSNAKVQNVLRLSTGVSPLPFPQQTRFFGDMVATSPALGEPTSLGPGVPDPPAGIPAALQRTHRRTRTVPPLREPGSVCRGARRRSASRVDCKKRFQAASRTVARITISSNGAVIRPCSSL